MSTGENTINITSDNCDYRDYMLTTDDCDSSCIAIKMFVPNSTNMHKLDVGGYKIEIPILSEYLKSCSLTESLVTIYMYDRIAKLESENINLTKRISELEKKIEK